MSSNSLCSHSHDTRESVILTRYSSKENIKSPEDLQYTLGKTLGSGTYAKVKAAWSPYEKKMIAIKIIEKSGATKEFLDKFLPREIIALQRLNHTNILSVYRLVETPRQVYFMLEMAHNGDLLDYINTVRCMPESQARFVMRGISAGIAHCHSQGIVHRDLKCENIMITKDMNIKIGDFGFSRQVDEKNTGVTTPCGSFSYAAPELFSDRRGSVYDAKKADIWSMGCILYAMVCGRLPFGDDSQVAKNVDKPLNFPVALTEDCRNILQFSMLNIDVEMRCTIAQLRICHWMRGPASPLAPYKTPKHGKECLPKVILDTCCSRDVAYLPSIPQPSVTLDTRQSIPVHLMQTAQHSPPDFPPASTSSNIHHAAASFTHVTTQGTDTPDSKPKEVHRRKKTAVSRLEQRLRVLNDPTNTVILPSPMPSKSGMKAKISSAGKKVFQTFLPHSSVHGS